jgi:hypothetical protein
VRELDRAAAGLLRRFGRFLQRVAGAWSVMPYERRLAAGSSLSLFLTLFLPWYQETVIASERTSKLLSASDSVTGWGAFSFVEAAVLLVALGVLTLLFQRAEGRAFHLPGGDGWVITIAGAWACCLVIWRIFDKQGASTHNRLATTSGIEWGIFVALIVAGVLTYSGNLIRAAHSPEPPLPGDPDPGGERRSRAVAAADESPAAAADESPASERSRRRRAQAAPSEAAAQAATRVTEPSEAATVAQPSSEAATVAQPCSEAATVAKRSSEAATVAKRPSEAATVAKPASEAATVPKTPAAKPGKPASAPAKPAATPDEPPPPRRRIKRAPGEPIRQPSSASTPGERRVGWLTAPRDGTPGDPPDPTTPRVKTSPPAWSYRDEVGDDAPADHAETLPTPPRRRRRPPDEQLTIDSDTE